MTLGEIRIFAPVWNEFIDIDCVIDTGADVCAIPLHLAALLGIVASDGRIHMWQVRDPLTLSEARTRLEWEGHAHEVDTVLLDIPSAFRRPAVPAEHCTRPDEPHLLSDRIIVGENFISLLDDRSRRRLLEQ